MKFQILNNEELGFFNDVGNKTAVIKMSGSDMILNPVSSGDIIIGDNNVINDIEIGIDSISSNMTFLGGGTISSNAGTLYIGDGVNDDKVVLTGVTIGSSVNFAAGLTGSFQGIFSGDGSNITGITATTAPGGNNKTIQFNDNNTATGGNSNFTFDKTTDTVELTGSLNVSGSASADFFFGDGSGLTNIVGAFPFTGSAGISGSLDINGNVTATEFYGDGSQLTGVVSSFSPIGDIGSIQFKKNNTTVSGSSDILYDFTNNSLLITGEISSSTLTSPGANLTGSFSGSFAGDLTSPGANLTGSFSGSFAGDGSNITGISGVFPYTGNATISGGLVVTGSGQFTNSSFLIGADGPAGSVFEFTEGSNTYDSMLIFRPTGNPAYNNNYWGSIRFNPANESGLTILAGNYTDNIIFGKGTPTDTNPTAFGKMNIAGLRLQTSYVQSIANAEEKLHVVGNGKFTGYVTASEIRNTNINAQSTTGRIQYNGSDRITWGNQSYIEGFDGIGAPNNQGDRDFHINKLKFYETSGNHITRIQPLLMQGHIQGKICIEGNEAQNYNYGTPGGDVYLYGGTDPYYGNGDGNVILGLTSASVARGNVGIGLEDPQTNLHVSGAVSASTYYGNGSNLTGVDIFPYTGSAIISGSLIIDGGPLNASLFEVNGTQGQLFSITDSLSGSLFAVSDVSGLPILEVFSDDTIKMGSFNNEALEISGSDVNFNNLPTSDPGVAGRLYQTGSAAIGATAGTQLICISQG